MGAMHPANLLFFLAILGVFATLIALIMGVRSMTAVESADPHRNEKPMFARVGLQALTVALAAAALVTAQSLAGGARADDVR